MPTELTWRATDTGDGEYARDADLTAIYWRERNYPTATWVWRVKLLRDVALAQEVLRDGHASNEVAAKLLATNFLRDGRRA